MKTPYKLAFGAVEAFDTILVALRIDGRTGFGEATILTGYTEETVEASVRLSRRLARELSGLDVGSACAALDAHLKASPFTVTAFRTAMEMALGHPSLWSAAPSNVRLVALLNATEARDVERELDSAFDAGYATVKVKVGFDIDADIERLRFIQRAAAGRFAITVDANQGYAREDGCRFAASIVPDSVLFFEQACSMHDWEKRLSCGRRATEAKRGGQGDARDSDRRIRGRR